jgi:hypothetical protein
MYIDDVADAIRRHVPPDLVPAGDTAMLFRVYAVLALAKGERVGLEDVHDAWAAWMTAHNPRHPSLTPVSELPAETRRSDQPYLDAIRAVARDRGRRALNRSEAATGPPSLEGRREPAAVG